MFILRVKDNGMVFSIRFLRVYQSSLRRILLLFLKDDIHRVASGLQLEETFKSFVCTFFFFFFVGCGEKN